MNTDDLQRHRLAPAEYERLVIDDLMKDAVCCSCGQPIGNRPCWLYPPTNTKAHFVCPCQRPDDQYPRASADESETL